MFESMLDRRRMQVPEQFIMALWGYVALFRRWVYMIAMSARSKNDCHWIPTIQVDLSDHINGRRSHI